MRACPFHRCGKKLPDRIFCCGRHWRQIATADRWTITDAYAAYQRGMITITELREIQQKVLGNRGTA